MKKERSRLGACARILAVSTVAALLSAPTRSQCAARPVAQALGESTAGTNGRARLSSDLPLIGLRYDLHLTGGLPNAHACVVLNRVENPLPLPAFGAVLYPALPLLPFPFTLDAQGNSPPILNLSAVPAGFCGDGFTVQGVVMDAGAMGGVAFTNAVRVRFGGNDGGSPFLDPVASPTAAASVQVSGVGAGVGDRIIVEGGAAPAETTVDSTNRFTLQVPLQPNRLNRLFVRERFPGGQLSAPATAEVVQDSLPPSLFIDVPGDNAIVSTPTINVSGRVGDLLSGFMGLTVTVNGRPAIVNPGIGTNGTFDARDVALVRDVPTPIVVVAGDVLGNEVTRSITVTYREPAGAMMGAVSGGNQTGSILQQLPVPIVVRVLRADRTPFVGKVVEFSVVRSDGRVAPSMGAAGSISMQAVTDGNGEAAAYWTLGSDAGCGNNRVRVTSQDIAGFVMFCASATAAPASRINVASGNNQVARIGGPVPLPIRVWVNDGCNGVAGVPVTFRITQGGGSLTGSSSRNASEIVVESTTTGHAEVNWTLGATRGANVVEVSAQGIPGTPVRFNALATIPDDFLVTRFSGTVLDNSQQPIEGATCQLRFPGQPVIEVTSDDKGLFAFEAIPLTGIADLVVDGATAVRVGGRLIDPGSLRFPKLHFEPFIEANVDNSLPMPVLLPRMDPANDREYDGTQDVELTVQGVSGLKIIVEAGTTVMYDGRTAGRGNPITLALNQVHAGDVPMPMPDGAAPPFAWTLQPGGATFDPPARIVYPNMSGLPPGATTYFLSFNHDTNRFEIVATGRVLADGSCSESDPGSGISVAGWGCQCPPYAPTGDCERPCTECPEALTIPPVTDPDAMRLENNPILWTSDDPTIQANLDILAARFAQFQTLVRAVDANADVRERSVYRPQAYQDHLLAVKRAYLALQSLPEECLQICATQIADINSECAHHGHCRNPVAQRSNHSLGRSLDITRSVGNVTQQQIIDLAAQANLDVLVERTAYHLTLSNSPSEEPAGDGPDPDIGMALVSVDGRTVTSFFPNVFDVSNIPVTRDLVRVEVTYRRDGETLYAQSGFFEILNGQTVQIPGLVLSATPPVSIVSIAAAPDAPMLTMPGETTPVRVLGRFSDTTERDVSSRAQGATYRSSNPSVATVDDQGIVTAQARGTAFITARNQGATAVTSVAVSPGDPGTTVIGFVQLEDGTPVEGADVRIVGQSGTSASDRDGRFVISGVFSLLGPLVASASATIGGDLLSGSSRSTEPTPGGLTDVGVITIGRRNVLMIWDVNNVATQALKQALEQAGMNVTLSATSETAYDGTNPSPSGFAAVIHMNGTTWSTEMPISGQQALVDFVLGGGGFLHEEWNAYEIDAQGRMQAMREITLFMRTSGADGPVTYLDVPAQAGHPILAGVPSMFTLTTGHNVGPARPFATDPVTVLMTDDSGSAAVCIREVGQGRVVGFHHAGNYNAQGTLFDPNVQQLYVDGVRWAIKETSAR